MEHDQVEQFARIRVVGVGGAGGNAIRHMIAAGLHYVEFVAMNTDAQALSRVEGARRLHLGEGITRGLGAGGDPAVGARAAEESADVIAETLAGADLVFITLGLGGGTGTGAGPIIARIARKLGALVVGVVTLPFAFEGRKRGMTAWSGLSALREQVDTLITIPNDRLFRIAQPDITLLEAFRVADDVLRQAVSGLADLVVVPGLINLDFADLRAVMAGAGTALMSIGEADGPDRARLAAQLAVASPLLGLEVHGAMGMVFNVTGGNDMTLSEVQIIAEILGDAAHPDATLIFGAVTDEAFAGRLRVTVVATGFATPPIQVPRGAGTVPAITRIPTIPREHATPADAHWEDVAQPSHPVRPISHPDLMPIPAHIQGTSAMPAYLRKHEG
jgi:cell division protein FtsZ